MSSKRWCLTSAALLFAVSALIVLLVVIVDPFEIYHRAWFYTPVYDSETQSYCNAGIAKSHDYDSIIIGSSVTENCFPSDYDAALGGRFVKLCMNGGLSRDHEKMMDIAFSTHDVRRVVYGLDLFAYNQYYTVQRAVTPDYLYDNNLFNDVSYWFNSSVLFRFIPEAFMNMGAYREGARDWMYVWDFENTDPSALVSQVDLASSLPPQKDIQAPCDRALENLEHNLLPYIRENRNTVFTVFFPPYSLLYWADKARSGEFEAFLAQKALLERVLLGEPNVEVYDFQLVTQWTQDYSLYVDLIHYKAFINAEMADMMAEGECRVLNEEQIEQNQLSLKIAVYSLFDGDWDNKKVM